MQDPNNVTQSPVNNSNAKGSELPRIPDKIYFTIGEVSKLCLLEPHVLRYWEQEFSQLKPNKRQGNRRYYQVPDIILIRRIKSLLYEEGYTIEGARSLLRKENSTHSVSDHKARETLSYFVTKLENLLVEAEEDTLLAE
ncbi:MAG: MerR family transcriptional regulator [Gammaproteobacteria bacterium]